MFNLRCAVMDGDGLERSNFTALVSAHSILYSARREAMLIACSDMSVLFKRMSSEFYENSMAKRGDALANNGLVDMVDLGLFLRAPCMSDLDTIISSKYNLFCQTASNWDTFSENTSGGGGGKSKTVGLSRLRL